MYWYLKILNSTLMIIIGSSLLIGANFTLDEKEFSTKVIIETNLEEKVANVISKVYKNTSLFAVTTNVTLFAPSNTNTANTQITSYNALQIEGILPAVPSNDSNRAPQTSEMDYKIAIEDITIWLDNQLNVIEAESKIRPFLYQSMEWLKDCQDCLQFKNMSFPSSGAQSLVASSASEEDLSIIEDNIEYLMNQIDKLAQAVENNEDGDVMEKNQWMIDYLERTNKELKENNIDLNENLLDVYQSIFQRDSSIIIGASEGLAETAQTALEKMSEVSQNTSNNDFKTNLWSWVAVAILLAFIVFLSIFNNRKGPNTVFLKPKKQKTNQSTQDENNKIDNNSNTNAKEVENETASYNPTLAFEDEGVMQSDIKSMKQSAISMSVGQQGGATQIVKDWLDDGGNTDNSSTNNEQKGNEDEEGK